MATPPVSFRVPKEQVDAVRAPASRATTVEDVSLATGIDADRVRKILKRYGIPYNKEQPKSLVKWTPEMDRVLIESAARKPTMAAAEEAVGHSASVIVAHLTKAYSMSWRAFVQAVEAGDVRADGGGD